ncbi:MAG TPA: condensation domain-containing protein, partial [Candidatus Acidoferrum sp.]|nr:condensation domain-containing protein [Candidatus Acidoferrum sp.]
MNPSTSTLLASAPPEQHKAYWRRRLSQPPPPPNLPWDHERPPVPSFVRASVSAQIGPGVWQEAQRMAQAAGTTPHVALLAALYALLFRYTGQGDLILGTAVAPSLGEPLQGASGSPELIALRMRVIGAMTARDLLDELAVSLGEATQNLPMASGDVLALPGPQSGSAGHIPFNVALILSEPPISGNGRSWRESAFEAHLRACALVIRAHAAAGGLTLSCDFDSDLLEAPTVRRLAGHFTNLLADIAARPDTNLDHLA